MQNTIRVVCGSSGCCLLMGVLIRCPVVCYVVCYGVVWWRGVGDGGGGGIVVVGCGGSTGRCWWYVAWLLFCNCSVE